MRSATATVLEKIKVSSGLTDYIAEIEILCWSKPQIYRRAVLRTMLILLLTMVGALIPVLHFLLIPLGLFSAVYIMLRSLKNKQSIKAGVLNCPECQKQISFDQLSCKFPLDLSCRHCERLITLSKVI